MDAIIILGLAYSVYRESRVGACLLVAMWLVNMATMGLNGLPMRVVLFAFFVRGAIATFALRKIGEDEAPPSGIVNQILN